MKLFFASDLHGSLPATEETIQLYLASGADHLILLGDILNYGPRNPLPDGHDPLQVAELLNQYSDQIIAVRGNCDSEVDQMLLNFPMMMDYAWVLLESGKRLFLTHGHLYNSEKRPSLREGDVIALGHTHVPVAEMQNGAVIFNPGSMTFPRNGLPRSYGLLENNTLTVQTPEGEVLAQTTI
ncbi:MULTISPECIES: phosphodiesterase [Vibrio]|uniref:phosphodiesterase n=1 Tax=Vibrio TaxID=662 RepID=UPI000BFFF9F1|nr:MULTISPECIES: phosphodiesterase [unclassified Vibrio]PHJ41995.1 phosphodiesterase [Vibrio sp. PID17_43]RIZ55994.1 phosphodiesterase [Vibrio sp. PID23_8]